jgi:hypothetical protein
MNPAARPFDGAKFRVARGATKLENVHGSGRRGSFA